MPSMMGSWKGHWHWPWPRRVVVEEEEQGGNDAGVANLGMDGFFSFFLLNTDPSHHITRHFRDI